MQGCSNRYQEYVYHFADAVVVNIGHTTLCINILKTLWVTRYSKLLLYIIIVLYTFLSTMFTVGFKTLDLPFGTRQLTHVLYAYNYFLYAQLVNINRIQNLYSFHLYINNISPLAYNLLALRVLWSHT